MESLGDLVGRESDARQVLQELSKNSELRDQASELLESAGVAAREDGRAGQRTFELLELLAMTIESQVQTMRGHARRVSFYASLLAERIGLGVPETGQVRIAAFLHDLGKIGIPSGLLLRPDALDDEERALVQRHPEIGARLVQPIGVSSGAVDAIRHHHERWDGGGYPNGLAGEQIPLLARLVAVTDAFDAMSSDRPYRQALDPQRVRAEIAACAGTQFDPTLAKEFLNLVEAGACDNDVEATATPWALTQSSARSGEAGRAADALDGDAR
jgi:HD-GYP domain-containing protein (c-di-GMP phosphodiesterase class II)